jgi:hypothetical protein
MAPEKRSLYEEAIELLERMNNELKGNSHLDTLNTKMIGVVKDLNEVSIEAITGKND